MLGEAGRHQDAVFRVEVWRNIKVNISKLDKMKQRARQLLNERKWEEAKIQLEKLCSKFPRDFDSWNLRAALCGQMNDLESALKCSKKALFLNPRHAGALYNHAMALSGLGNLTEAVSVYQKALQYSPQNPAIYYNLGNLYKDLQNYDEAIKQLHECIKLDPGRAEALFSLGTLYTELGQVDDALEYLNKSIAADTNIKSKADYFITALSNSTSSSDEGAYDHVKSLHDTHAEIFDYHLQKGLGYQVPTQFYEIYRQLNKSGDKIDVLDLGCGTGLCGIAFKELSNTITGVDLSPGMLEKAHLTNCYDELVESELSQYLEDNVRKFDLILSADVFIYIGKLDRVMPACTNALKPNGYMFFSVEKVENQDYKLRISGRYAHSAEYIERLASESGMEVVMRKNTIIRKEIGRNIDGYIFVLKQA